MLFHLPEIQSALTLFYVILSILWQQLENENVGAHNRCPQDVLLPCAECFELRVILSLPEGKLLILPLTAQNNMN